MNKRRTVAFSLLATLGCIAVGGCIGAGAYAFEQMGNPLRTSTPADPHLEQDLILGHWLEGTPDRVVNVITFNRDQTISVEVPGSRTSYTCSYQIDWYQKPPVLTVMDAGSGQETRGRIAWLSTNKIQTYSIATVKGHVAAGPITQYIRMTEHAYQLLLR